MPQFYLNTSPSPDDIIKAVAYGYAKPGQYKAHRFFDLTTFAAGYVEAMFFTNGDTGYEGRDNHLNELGTKRLVRTAIESIARDCAAFEAANRADLDAAKELEPGSDDFQHARDKLNDSFLGSLFWLARQGHGVGFDDDGNAECLYALQGAAQNFGEAHCEVRRGWIYHRSTARRP